MIAGLPKHDRVVIAGIGLASPNGNNLAEFRASLLAGRSGVTPYEIRYGGKTVAGVCTFDELKYQKRKDLRRGTRAGSVGIYCANEAIADAGLGETRGPTPIGRPGTPAESLGMVISFAASPGQPALDGAVGGNSPYAAALLKHLSAGGYSFGDLMTLVTEEVYLETRAQQLPWVNSSLRRVLTFGEPVESGPPHRVDIGAQLAQRLGIGAIDPPRAGARLVHEAGVLQHLQMLRHGRPADRQPGRQLAHRPRRLDHALEHRAARRVGEGGELGFVSHDLC